MLSVSNLPNRYCTPGTGLPEVDEAGILPTERSRCRGGWGSVNTDVRARQWRRREGADRGGSNVAEQSTWRLV